MKNVRLVKRPSVLNVKLNVPSVKLGVKRCWNVDRRKKKRENLKKSLERARLD